MLKKDFRGEFISPLGTNTLVFYLIHLEVEIPEIMKRFIKI